MGSEIEDIFAKTSLSKVAGARSRDHVRILDVQFDRPPFSVAFGVGGLIFDRIECLEFSGDLSIDPAHFFETINRVEGAAGPVGDDPKTRSGGGEHRYLTRTWVGEFCRISGRQSKRIYSHALKVRTI